MRINRSAQVEGAFGSLKQDLNYKRLRRADIDKVETEFILTFLGYSADMSHEVLYYDNNQ